MELQLQELDYWAIGIYILLMAGIGLSFGWFIKDVGAYFKGNGHYPLGDGHRYEFYGIVQYFCLRGLCRDCLRVRVGFCYGILVHCAGMYHW